jgi:hypothetical protein
VLEDRNHLSEMPAISQFVCNGLVCPFFVQPHRAKGGHKPLRLNRIPLTSFSSHKQSGPYSPRCSPFQLPSKGQ